MICSLLISRCFNKTKKNKKRKEKKRKEKKRNRLILHLRLLSITLLKLPTNRKIRMHFFFCGFVEGGIPNASVKEYNQMSKGCHLQTISGTNLQDNVEFNVFFQCKLNFIVRILLYYMRCYCNT